MVFRIYRTSDWGEDRPCQKAYRELDHWAIKINSLDELMELQSKEKYKLIIGAASIEIYDDYRE